MRPNSKVLLVIATVTAAVPSSVIAAEHLGEPARTSIARPAGPAAASVRTPGSAVGGVMSTRPVSQEELAILAIRDDARQRVDQLQSRIAGTPEGPARQPLMREVVRIKQEAELLVLETMRSFATARGDRRGVRRIEEARERLLHPEVVKAAPADPRASSGAATHMAPSAPGKGGPR